MNSMGLERKKCVVCFINICGRNSRLKTGDLRNLLKNCSLHLPPAVVAGTPLHKIRLANHAEVAICAHCRDLLLELSHVGDQLAKFQREMSNLTLAFSMAVLYRRSSPGPDNGEHSSNQTIQLDISRLPPKWFRKSVPSCIAELSEELPTTSGQGNDNSVNPGNDDTIGEIDSSNSLPTEILDLAFENWSNNGSIDLEWLDPTTFLDPQCDLLDILEIPEQIENSETQEGNIILTNSTSNKNINNNNAHVTKTPVQNLMSLSQLIETVSMPRIVVERLQLQGDKIKKRYSSMKKSYGKGSQNWKRGQFNSGSSKDGEKWKTVHSVKCQYCKNVLSSKKTLKVHLRKIHGVEKKFKCSSCEREYFSLGNLTKHKKLLHAGRKSCKCVLHNKFIHIVGRPYKCSFCKKRFKFQCKLKLHEIIHSGVVKGLHICTVCKKSFKYHSQLKKHEIVHSKGEPYNYNCSVCKRSFKYRSLMKRHEIIHQKNEDRGRGPYKCSTCSMKFSQPSEKIKHELIHKTEIRPYQCSICKKTYDVSTKLKRHVLGHSVGIPKKFTKFGRPTKVTIVQCQTNQNPIKCSA